MNIIIGGKKWVVYSTIGSGQTNVILLSLPKAELHPIFPTPSLGQDMTQGQFLSGVFNRFEFRFFLLQD